VPQWLVVVLAGAGLLVSALALRQVASIIGPVLLTPVLVAGVHPLTGFLRRRGGADVARGDRHPDHAGGRASAP
jgi:predicted PurR-regulated permease PerM